MPVQWSSTDYMLMIFLHLKKAINSVLAIQEWDASVREHLTPNQDDWQVLEEMKVFFELFRRPTTKSQADNYPTLHNTIPDYLFLMRRMKVYSSDPTKPTLQKASKAAWTVLNDYFKKSMATSHSFVVTISDPRYRLVVFEHLFEADGGVQAPLYKKGKVHFEHTYRQYKLRADKIRIHEETEALYDKDGILIEPIERPRIDEDDFRTSPYEGFDDFLSTLPCPTTVPYQDEVSRYINTPRSDYLPRDSSHEQIRHWWLKNQFRFPIIFQMWRDHAVIPATSAPSERVFSAAGNLITKKRTRMASETIRYVICLRAWGLIPEADDEEEIAIVDLTDSVGSPQDLEVVERAVVIQLPSLVERRAEERKQQEEREKNEALRMVAGVIIRDDWEAANKRLLEHRAKALIKAQEEALLELTREYEDN